MREDSINFTDISDLGLWLGSFFVIGLITAAIQFLSKSSSSRFYYRKALHILAVAITAFTIAQTHNTRLLGLLLLLVGLGLAYVVKVKFLNISKGRSWGIALFPIALGILLVFEMTESRYISTAAYILAFADAFAGIVGVNLSKKHWKPLHEEKSLLGSVAFFLTTLTIILALHPFFYVQMGSIAIIAFLITCGELFSYRGSDNFTIPFISALLLEQLNQGFFHSEQAILILMVGLIAFPIMIKGRWLNLAGALAALVLGLFIGIYLPWPFLLYPFLFLVIGSLLSKCNKQAKRESKGRDAVQVFANGGAALFFLLISQGNFEHLFALFILCFSVALADTASSELGRYINGKTWDILNGKEMKTGLSGGISFAGSFAGLVAGGLLPLVAYTFGHIEFDNLILLTILSFLGMLIDSIIGSAFQVKYISSDHQIIEVNTGESRVLKGYKWVDNDMVNFLGILTTVIVFKALHLI